MSLFQHTCHTAGMVTTELYVLHGCGTHIRRVETQAQQSVNDEGDNRGNGGDDAGDAGVQILDITDPPQFFRLSLPQACERDGVTY